VIRLLTDLVEHFADAPRRIPMVRDGEVAAPDPATPGAAALAVHYVSGMTDRYALALGVDLLGWRPEDLPRGV
jgi:dGTP triphosphohydrolase